MARFAAVSSSTATGRARVLLRQVEVMMGQAPHLMRTMANAPAVLEGYLAFEASLAGGTLSLALHEQIALVVAGTHGCRYERCRHRGLGELAGLTERELLATQQARASDAQVEAALRFAWVLVMKRGRVTDGDLEAVLQASYSDAEIMEIIAVVAMNVLTNYVALVAQTDLDVSMRLERDF